MKFPFNSKRKRMSVIIDDNGTELIFLKGASELILQSCTQWKCAKTG